MAAINVINPKQPKESVRHLWECESVSDFTGFGCVIWRRRSDRVVVISAVEVAKEEIGPEYHLSMSSPKGRMMKSDCSPILRQFDLEDAEEDNHIDGTARHYWRPVNDELVGVPCACKENQEQVHCPNTDYTYSKEKPA